MFVLHKHEWSASFIDLTNLFHVCFISFPLYLSGAMYKQKKNFNLLREKVVPDLATSFTICSLWAAQIEELWIISLA